MPGLNDRGTIAAKIEGAPAPVPALGLEQGCKMQPLETDMSDTANPNRREPIMEPAADAPPVAVPAAVVATPVSPAAQPAPRSASVSATGLSTGGEQLSRIEDKAARIEEKFARIETLMQRVETASLALADVARQQDVATLDARVRRLPGFSGLIVSSIVTAILTAALTIAIIRYAPGLVAR